MAWKSQRTRAIDLAMQQGESARSQIDALQGQVGRLHTEIVELHRQLARRDVELVSALSQVRVVSDQLRIQNDEDRAHRDRIDHAIELLTELVAARPAALGGWDGPSVTDVTDVTDVDLRSPHDTAAAPGPTVIGGSVDPSLRDEPLSSEADRFEVGAPAVGTVGSVDRFADGPGRGPR